MIHRLSASMLAQLPVSVARNILKQPQYDSAKNGGSPKQLLVDISEIIKGDTRTGIQRVVRGILQHLFQEPPSGYQVKPVFADRNHGYCYAPVSINCLQADELARHNTIPVVAVAGDIFLGLDLSAHLLPKHQDQLLRWKRHRVGICVVVYDLLPLMHPHWFKLARHKTFKRWLKTLAIYADDLICISESVKSDLCSWLRAHYGLEEKDIRLHTIPLGADIESTLPSAGLTAKEESMLKQLQQKKYVLMVGTLEPRKGYADALVAFERLWAEGEQTTLVIVGKPGWKTDELQDRLRSHPEQKMRLYWFESASDEMLERLYQSSFGILMASEAEGFGLPLVEALRFNKPVLARKIDAYQEQFSRGVYFFETDMITSLRAFCSLGIGGQLESNPYYKIPLWADTTNALKNLIFKNI